MHWEVGITGANGVLQHVADVLNDGEVSVVQVEGAFVLRSEDFQQLPDATSVRARAAEIVDVLSALARLDLQSIEELRVGNVVRVADDGRRDYFVQLEPAQLRITAGLVTTEVRHADGDPNPTNRYSGKVKTKRSVIS